MKSLLAIMHVVTVITCGPVQDRCIFTIATSPPFIICHPSIHPWQRIMKVYCESITSLQNYWLYARIVPLRYVSFWQAWV